MRHQRPILRIAIAVALASPLLAGLLLLDDSSSSTAAWAGMAIALTAAAAPAGAARWGRCGGSRHPRSSRRRGPASAQPDRRPSPLPG